MSTSPRRDPAEPGAALASEAQQDLTRALAAQAAARNARQQLEEQVQLARRGCGNEFIYRWTTDSDREATLRVFFVPGEEPEIAAAELVELDGRPPTPRERLKWEESFLAEMHAAGDLWEHVVSFIWER